MGMELEKAREVFKDDRFATEAASIEIDDTGENYAKCSMAIQPKHINQNNAVMGGAIFTIADFAVAVAANTEETLAVSMNANINFMAPAKGKTLFAEASPIKDGRTIAVYEVKVYDDLDTQVAYMTVNCFKSGKK